MKENKSISFSKATISIDNDTNELIIQEVGKDETKVYNLTQKLSEWVGVEGINLKISKDSDLPSEE